MPDPGLLLPFSARLFIPARRRKSLFATPTEVIYTSLLFLVIHVQIAPSSFTYFFYHPHSLIIAYFVTILSRIPIFRRFFRFPVENYRSKRPPNGSGMVIGFDLTDQSTHSGW